MSLRKWSHRACAVTLVIMLAGCGGGSSSTGSSLSGSGSGTTGSTGGSGGVTGGSNPPQVTGVSTPKSVSVVTAN